MEIKLAKEMGMCFGVRDTLKMIDEAGQSRERIDTLGTLVHNPQLVERLSAQGVEVVKSLEGVSAPTIAVTAHGAATEAYRRGQDARLELRDTTCPLVTRVQQLAKSLMEQGHWVIVYGDAPHPEVIGILGWANSVFDEQGSDGVVSEDGKAKKANKFGMRRAICAKSVEEIEAALAAD